MKIRVAKTIGFCQGVRRALDLTRSALLNSKVPVYSYGQIIHNSGVIKDLQALGLRVVKDIKSLENGSTIIFPSHGVASSIKNLALKKNLKIIDTTCPYVNKVHKIVSSLKDQNYKIIIFGEKGHPEVKAIKSLAGNAFIVDKSIKLRDNKHLAFGIISQTTQARDKYFEFIYRFLVENPFVKEVRVFNTICADVVSRQKQVLDLCKKVDLMFIIGGKNSANTKRLKALCQINKVKAYHIEELSELANKVKYFKRYRNIGIATGASTPNFLVKNLIKCLKNKKSRIGVI